MCDVGWMDDASVIALLACSTTKNISAQTCGLFSLHVYREELLNSMDARLGV